MSAFKIFWRPRALGLSRIQNFGRRSAADPETAVDRMAALLRRLRRERREKPPRHQGKTLGPGLLEYIVEPQLLTYLKLTGQSS